MTWIYHRSQHIQLSNGSTLPLDSLTPGLILHVGSIVLNTINPPAMRSM